MTLKGRVAIVTGGGRGLGAGYCRALAAEGASVVVADIAEGGAREIADEISGLAVKVDVSDDTSVRTMVASAMEQYGRIDILINNAAVYTELLPRQRGKSTHPPRLRRVRSAGSSSARRQATILSEPCFSCAQTPAHSSRARA